MENLGTTVAGAIETVTTVMGTVVSNAVDNPLIILFIGAGIAGLAIGMFRKLKKVAK